MTQPVTTAAGLPFTGGLAPQVQRVVYEYPVPEEFQECSGGEKITSIGVAELTPQEELDAARRAGGDNMALALELSKTAMVEVNGTPVTIGDGSADIWWSKMRPQLRTLITTVYADNNTPSEKAVEGFRKGRKAKVR